MQKSYQHAFAQVRIWDVAGGRSGGRVIYDLWQPDFPFVSSVSVTSVTEAVPTITVNIDAPFAEGLAMLDGTMFTQNNMMGVRIGWTDTGDTTRWYIGQLYQGGVGLTLSPDGLTGTLTANAASVNSAYKPVSNVQKRNPIEAIKFSADKIGFDVDVSTGVFLKLDIEAKKWDFAYGPYGHLEIIRKICGDFDCRWWIGVNNFMKQCVYIRTRSEVAGSNVSRTFKMRGGFDPSNRQMPMLSFQPEQRVAEWNAAGASPVGRQVALTYVNDADDLIVEVVSNDQNDNAKIGGAVSSNPVPTDVAVTLQSDQTSAAVVLDHVADGKEEVTARIQVPPPTDASVTQTQADAARSNESDGLNMTIVTFGIPEIELMETVSVLGCGKRYNGVYQIKSVTHQWNEGGWETTLAVFNSGAAANAVAQIAPAGGVNEAPIVE